MLLPKWKNSLGLLHTLTMKKLQLKKGSLLLIKTLSGQILLKSWPYDLLEDSTIALPGVSLFKHYVTAKSSIEHYTGYIFPADRVVLCPKEDKKFMHTKAFKVFLSEYLGMMFFVCTSINIIIRSHITFFVEIHLSESTGWAISSWI